MLDTNQGINKKAKQMIFLDIVFSFTKNIICYKIYMQEVKYYERSS